LTAVGSVPVNTPFRGDINISLNLCRTGDSQIYFHSSGTVLLRCRYASDKPPEILTCAVSVQSGALPLTKELPALMESIILDILNGSI